GKLKWDDPVTKHLPGFQMYDSWVTRQITVRDLLCHRSGLPRYEAVWYGTDADRDEILRRMRYARSTTSFRSQFGYQNIMYLAAGQVVPAITGKSWDEFVQQRFFTPLEMNASNTSVKKLAGVENLATPHARLDGKVQPIAYRNIDNIAPAGSINSNVVDMARWLRLQLNQGRSGDKQLVSARAIKEMYTPQIVLPPPGERIEKLVPEV